MDKIQNQAYGKISSFNLPINSIRVVLIKVGDSLLKLGALLAFVDRLIEQVDEGVE